VASFNSVHQTLGMPSADSPAVSLTLLLLIREPLATRAVAISLTYGPDLMIAAHSGGPWQRLGGPRGRAWSGGW
jgi:hypothetical protein